MKHCPKCGASTDKLGKEGNPLTKCPSCGVYWSKLPKVEADDPLPPPEPTKVVHDGVICHKCSYQRTEADPLAACPKCGVIYTRLPIRTPICPKCSHERTATDPLATCPKCGVIYINPSINVSPPTTTESQKIITPLPNSSGGFFSELDFASKGRKFLASFVVMVLLLGSGYLKWYKVNTPSYGSSDTSIITAQAEAATPDSVAYKAGKVFRDCPDCPEMVIIPPGNFEMGSPNTEASRLDNEGPAHHVTIGSTFAVSKTEITRAQFETFVKETHYDTDDKCWIVKEGKWEERNGMSWRYPSQVQEDNEPAACLNWSDAKAYTEWLSRKTGKQYRLPSEAEWEYAARGNTSTAYHWGDSQNQSCDYANVMDDSGKSLEHEQGAAWEANNCRDSYAYTAPVGRFKANNFGLYDMIGNVMEWVEDSGHTNYNEAPIDGSAMEGASSIRVFRGGAWNSPPKDSRTATRTMGESAMRSFNVGFRIAMTLPK